MNSVQIFSEQMLRIDTIDNEHVLWYPFTQHCRICKSLSRFASFHTGMSRQRFQFNSKIRYETIDGG